MSHAAAPSWWKQHWIALTSLIVTTVGLWTTLYPRTGSVPPDQPQQLMRALPQPAATAPTPAAEPAAPLQRVRTPVLAPIPPSDLHYDEEARLQSLRANYLQTNILDYGCRKHDCYVISGRRDGAEDSRLDVYRWGRTGATARIRSSYPVSSVEYVKFSPVFEEAIVASFHHGQGGYLELHVLLWNDGELIDLTRDAPVTDRGSGGWYSFDDLDGDSVLELGISWGQYIRESEVFRFDDIEVAYLESDQLAPLVSDPDDTGDHS